MNINFKESAKKKELFKITQTDRVSISYLAFFSMWPLSLMTLILLIRYNQDLYLTLLVPSVILLISSLCAIGYKVKSKFIRKIISKIYYSLMLLSTASWIILIPFCITAFIKWF